MEPDLQAIGRRFAISGEFVSGGPYGMGHINDTYAAVYRQDAVERRFIFQRINHNVFKHPEGLMANIVAVTSHLSRKIQASGGDPLRETLTLIPAVDGRSHCRTAAGDYWRVYVFIEGARTYEAVENLEHVSSAGRAFGRFQQLLSDFPADELIETIPDFHHTGKRFVDFTRALEEDVKHRADSARPEIEFVLQRSDSMNILVDLLAAGRLKQRITHNDTKFNNVMIDDRNGEGVCIIDLDTVMPGLSLYDFGDSIRSLANTGAEDEPDLSRVEFDIGIFELYTRGYLEATRGLLQQEEVDLLPFAAQLMTLECGMRFLADYLQGDIYFKTHAPDHNLLRCRTQFKMVQGMEAAADRMAAIVQRWAQE
ncbi:MAG: aminoglycoside phosphotransferase family protein [Anaerolineales bacterium]|nr:aminoglycoside phosphotransferase family protein [Anaerolineales bacterium]